MSIDALHSVERPTWFAQARFRGRACPADIQQRAGIRVRPRRLR